VMDAMNRGRVERWLVRLPNRENIRAVAIDMWGPYKAAVKSTMPDVKIIVDAWHVLSKLNMALDRVRNRARRAAGIRKNPQKGRRLLQTSRHKLSPMRRMLLDGIVANDPLIDAAWNAKEVFYDIWSVRPREEAERLFDRWAASIPDSVEEEFRPIAKMVENWRQEIFGFFDYPITNAYTEARNGLVKKLNRAGNGYSFDTIRAKALLAESYGPTERCLGCKGEFPAASMKHRDIPAAVLQSGFFPVTFCGSCDFIFHTECQEKTQEAIKWLSVFWC
jgi:transposase